MSVDVWSKVVPGWEVRKKDNLSGGFVLHTTTLFSWDGERQGEREMEGERHRETDRLTY